jgi:hypothetical protein
MCHLRLGDAMAGMTPASAPSHAALASAGQRVERHRERRRLAVADIQERRRDNTDLGRLGRSPPLVRTDPIRQPRRRRRGLRTGSHAPNLCKPIRQGDKPASRGENRRLSGQGGWCLFFLSSTYRWHGSRPSRSRVAARVGPSVPRCHQRERRRQRLGVHETAPRFHLRPVARDPQWRRVDATRGRV